MTPTVPLPSKPPPLDPVTTRLRLRYSKEGKIRFVGHRDLARIWERSFRRARLPLAFSEGFTPHPKVSFGLALPVGWESTAEYLDLSLTEPRDGDEIVEGMNDVLPEGVRVAETRPVQPGAASLSSTVARAAYSVWFGNAAGGAHPSNEQVSHELEAILSVESLIASRLKKGVEVTDDLRPLIFEMSLAEANVPLGEGTDGYGVPVEMLLATQPRALRPEEIAAVITTRGIACEALLVRRTAQYALVRGDLKEPMSPEALGEADAA